MMSSQGVVCTACMEGKVCEEPVPDGFLRNSNGSWHFAWTAKCDLCGIKFGIVLTSETGLFGAMQLGWNYL